MVVFPHTTYISQVSEKFNIICRVHRVQFNNYYLIHFGKNSCFMDTGKLSVISSKYYTIQLVLEYTVLISYNYLKKANQSSWLCGLMLSDLMNLASVCSCLENPCPKTLIEPQTRSDLTSFLHPLECYPGFAHPL